MICTISLSIFDLCHQVRVASNSNMLSEIEKESKQLLSRALFNLGVAYKDTKGPNKAIQAYEDALSLNPSLQEAHFNLGYTFQVIEYIHKKQKSADCLQCISVT
jgi:tetratricopeptide (TPR) repeat protein